MMDVLEAPSPFATVNEFGNVDYAEQNKGITPLFFVELVADDAASEAAGAPRRREIEMVRLMIAGDMLSSPVHPVNAEFRERFSAAYAKFKAGQTAIHVEGTPLRDWPALSRLQIAELEDLKIYSVDQLAGVADQNINRIQDGRILRAKADAFLKLSKDSAHANKLAADNERLRGSVDDLTAKLADLSARVEQMQAEQQPKRAAR